jgi:hypothetical protein
MLGNATASLGMVMRLARLQEAGTYRDEHSALAKAYRESRGGASTRHPSSQHPFRWGSPRYVITLWNASR